ncbi:MAG: hypothetical protein WDZ28_04410 [Simkaniaceae bacterium]
MTPAHKAALFCFTAFFFLSLASLFLFFPITQKDRNLFHKLSEIPKSENRALTQSRKNVRKDLFFSSLQTRKHVRISSEISNLYFDENRWVEQLNQIQCLIADKDENRGFFVKEITSMEGNYDFHKNLFTAFDVSLNYYESPVNPFFQIPTACQTFLKGVATELTLSISESGPEVKADHFQALINSKN